MITSASQNSPFSKVCKRKSKACSQGLLEKDIFIENVPERLNSQFLSYFDDFLSYYQVFLSKICSESWHRYSTKNIWAYNETTLICGINGDWRGSCFTQPGLKPFHFWPEDRLQYIGAPLLQSTELIDVSDRKKLYCLQNLLFSSSSWWII